CFDKNTTWITTNSSVNPKVPNNLKFTQASVSKLLITYRLVKPIMLKKLTQAKLSLRQILSGRLISLPASLLIRGCFARKWLPSKIIANSQYTAVGFHLINV